MVPHLLLISIGEPVVIDGQSMYRSILYVNGLRASTEFWITSLASFELVIRDGVHHVNYPEGTAFPAYISLEGDVVW